MAKILDGKEASIKWLEQIKAQAALLQPKPKLVIIRAGEDAASQVYVRNKVRACKECAIICEVLHYGASASTEEILLKIKQLNADSSITGMIVQVPLPPHIDILKLQEAILPLKDVDGFCPENQRLLEQGTPRLVAATPAGVMRLLEHYSLSVKGKTCAVMGRSKTVGAPLASLLKNAGAKVEVVHSKTENPVSITSNADFLFIAIGKPKFVGAEMVKKGAVVIDIGINRLASGKLCGDTSASGSLSPTHLSQTSRLVGDTASSGSLSPTHLSQTSRLVGDTPSSGSLSPTRIVGDSNFEEVEKKASYITPVPGGVGPMTVASLLANTLKAYKMQKNKKK